MVGFGPPSMYKVLHRLLVPLFYSSLGLQNEYCGRKVQGIKTAIFHKHVALFRQYSI